MTAASARFCCRKTTEVVAVTRTNQGASLSKVRIAKFHAALIGDTTVYAETRRKEAVRCFFRQGDLSSGCGIYCVATALAVLGVVKANAMESAANRKHGLVREVFRALQHTYFDGVTASELYDALEAIPLPLKLTLRDAESTADIERARSRYGLGAVERATIERLTSEKIAELSGVRTRERPGQTSSPSNKPGAEVKPKQTAPEKKPEVSGL